MTEKAMTEKAMTEKAMTEKAMCRTLTSDMLTTGLCAAVTWVVFETANPIAYGATPISLHPQNPK
jgi:hypothetical protein